MYPYKPTMYNPNYPIYNNQSSQRSPLKSNLASKIHTQTKSKKSKLPHHLKEFIVPEIECPDCRRYGEIIEDIRSGNTVCIQCGLILKNQIISYQSEWRTFENDDKSRSDPNRCGSIQNIYLSDFCGLDTKIGTTGSLKNAQNIVMAQSSKDKKTKNGILDIQKYGNRLNLTADVKHFSSELFKELMTRHGMNGKKGLNIVTACIYIACRQCNCHRSLDTLCYDFTVDKKVIKKILNDIHKLKASNKIKIPIIRRGKGYIAKTTGEILAIKFANQLKLNKNTIKNLRLISRKIASLHILDGKKPETIAAAAIYLTCIVNGDETQQRCIREISIIAKISEHTIKKAFRENLYLRLISLLPNGYGDAAAISKILRKK